MTTAYSGLDLKRSKLLFEKPLVKGLIVNRPNRYVAYVTLEDGSVVKAHTPVGGRIGGLTVDGLPALLSGPYSGRSTDYTVEAIGLGQEDSSTFQWLGINQGAANSYVKAFLRAGLLSAMVPAVASPAEATLVHPERKLDTSRIDFFIDGTSEERELWIEVKTPLIKIHAPIPEEIPVKTDFSSDKVSARMPKQIEALLGELKAGKRAVLLGVFLYENTLKTSDELKLKDNLDLEGLLTEGKNTGLEGWQLTLAIDSEGIALKNYGHLT